MPRRPGEVTTSDRQQWTKRMLLRAAAFVVRNACVYNGEMLLRQVLGIPMGANCAPPLANLYLYSYESEFIDRLSQLDINTAREFHITFRLIDDVLAVDCVSWLTYVGKAAEEGGIYPRALCLNDTTVSSNEVNFLGLNIVSMPDGCLRIDVYDKRAEFPFCVIRYPRVDSLIPASIPYGVFVGQVHRIHRICSLWDSFARSAVLQASVQATQGCSVLRLKRLMRTFLVGQPKLRWKVAISTICARFTQRLGELLRSPGV